MEYLTLRQLAEIIRRAINDLAGECWVVAEISQVSLNSKSGHCYQELIEKEEDRRVAQLRATVWAARYAQIASVFREKTGRNLDAGMKVLMLAKPVFHEIYGLSLNVSDIDPSYTLGDMALRKKETIERLKREGIFGLNKARPVPRVPQRLAVISSGTAAGLGDFLNVLNGSPYGYEIAFFEAYMQGERAEKSILDAMGQCARTHGDFDVLAVIRGGGSQGDLHCFDGYGLAKGIALFPLAVLTGIGHERDETVADMVACRSLITPTAVAEFIVSRTREFEELLEDLSARIAERATGLISAGKSTLVASGALLASAARNCLVLKTHALSSLAQDFEHSVLQELHARRGLLEKTEITLELDGKAYISSRYDEIRNLGTKVALLDPRNVLRRGYSITSLMGRTLKDASGLKKGEIIETRLYGGKITSKVDKSDGG